MSNDLIPFSFDDLAIVEDNTQIEALQEALSQTSYLPRLQLVTKGKYVDTGKISPGHYGTPLAGGEEILDLGKEIDIIPFAVRPKALNMRNKEAIIENFDMASDTFQEIMKLSEVSDSNCMWGPSYLVYERNTGKFYEFYLGTKSARGESGKLNTFLPVSPAQAEKAGTETRGPLPCTLSARYAVNKSKGYGWHVPVMGKCSEPFTNPPTLDVIREQHEAFKSAKGTEIEVVTEEEVATASKRRR